MFDINSKFIYQQFQTNSPKGWDFVVQWVLHIVKTKRTRRKRHKKRTNNNLQHCDNSDNYDVEEDAGDSSLESRSNFYHDSPNFVVYAETISCDQELKSYRVSERAGETEPVQSSFATVV